MVAVTQRARQCGSALTQAGGVQLQDERRLRGEMLRARRAQRAARSAARGAE